MADFKTRSDLIAPITPNVWHNSEAQEKFPGFLKPAGWLPVAWVNDKTKDAFVISSGKVVALDTTGRVVPAGLRTALVSGISYTATDVTYKVDDITTGVPVVAAVTYTGLQVAQALVGRGLVLENDVASVTAANVIPEFISQPIGVVAMDVLVWAGDDKYNLKFSNYQLQESVGVYTKAQMIVPMQCSAEDSTAFVSATLNTAGTTVYAAGSMVDAGEYWNATNLALLPRYSGVLTSASPVVGLGLDNQPVAAITDRTPFVCSRAGVAVNSKPSPDLVKASGDFFLDHETGVVIIHSTDWTTAVAATATITFTYDYYSNATASGHRYTHVDGRIKPGDYLTFDADSNFTLLDPTTVAHVLSKVGRVAQIKVEPAGLLQYVKTGFKFDNSPNEFHMPGSATKGFSDRISLTDEVVADRCAIINVSFL